MYKILIVVWITGSHVLILHNCLAVETKFMVLKEYDFIFTHIETKNPKLF